MHKFTKACLAYLKNPTEDIHIPANLIGSYFIGSTGDIVKVLEYDNESLTPKGLVRKGEYYIVYRDQRLKEEFPDGTGFMPQEAFFKLYTPLNNEVVELLYE